MISLHHFKFWIIVLSFLNFHSTYAKITSSKTAPKHSHSIPQTIPDCIQEVKKIMGSKNDLKIKNSKAEINYKISIVFWGQ